MVAIAIDAMFSLLALCVIMSGLTTACTGLLSLAVQHAVSEFLTHNTSVDSECRQRLGYEGIPL